MCRLAVVCYWSQFHPWFASIGGQYKFDQFHSPWRRSPRYLTRRKLALTLPDFVCCSPFEIQLCYQCHHLIQPFSVRFHRILDLLTVRLNVIHFCQRIFYVANYFVDVIIGIHFEVAIFDSFWVRGMVRWMSDDCLMELSNWRLKVQN